ncbi:hypothetical protein N1851_019529 [Merluccius polli]|uniref:Uncharacterized protein n=1 Tax=Merluccius polli TaxID=89951 RepID=A0AA47MLG7_MERPO|nr:hypothetical protein N1851_019529 [Merluccius polli]
MEEVDGMRGAARFEAESRCDSTMRTGREGRKKDFQLLKRVLWDRGGTRRDGEKERRQESGEQEEGREEEVWEKDRDPKDKEEQGARGEPARFSPHTSLQKCQVLSHQWSKHRESHRQRYPQCIWLS